jgi:4-hydroxy-3-methylbut-2-en-1-yl diphosphate synthase IspG/GcpE
MACDEHLTCHICSQIVSPVVTESRMFITKSCPRCGITLSDVEKSSVVRGVQPLRGSTLSVIKW